MLARVGHSQNGSRLLTGVNASDARERPGSHRSTFPGCASVTSLLVVVSVAAPWLPAATAGDVPSIL